MRQDLDELEKLLAAMTAGLSPSNRRQVALKSARALQKANADRIAKNVEPDGAPMTPRKLAKDGRIRKRARMFKNLRKLRHLLARATPDGIEVGFFDQPAAKVAFAHHYGLEDKVDRAGRIRTKYPARRLLGFARGDEERIMDALEGLFKC